MKRTALNARGFTLVELLIAAAISVLALGIIFAVYCTLLNTAVAQKMWRERWESPAAALDCLARDLACALAPSGATNAPFEAFAGGEEEDASIRIRFYSAFPEGVSNAWGSHYSVSALEYSFRGAAATGAFTLARERSPFRVPAGNPSDCGLRQWRGIRVFRAEFFDGQSWTNRWGAHKGTGVLPQAVRISVGTGTNPLDTLRSEVTVNAGRPALVSGRH